MFSILRKNPALAAVAAMALAVGGCSSVHITQVHFSDQPRPAHAEQLDSTPIVTDGAMAQRQWDVSVAAYANDAVLTYPNYEPLQIDALGYYGDVFVEPVFFIVNTFYLPVGLVLTPPWTWQVNKALSLPPSYTLMPALPDGPEKTPTY